MAHSDTGSSENKVANNLNLRSNESEKVDDATGDILPTPPRVPGKHRFSRLAVLGIKNPPPPKASIDDADIIPEATAGWLSLVTFDWITPLLSLGYARPLEASDLYKLQDDRSASYIADRILASFDARRIAADNYNSRLSKGEVKASWRVIWWTIRGNRAAREKQWREVEGKQKASLALAMNDAIKCSGRVAF
jgi:hypothetical protein